MNYERQEIKNGVAVHIIKTNKFKTDLLAVTLTTEILRESVTKNAMIPLVLRDGSCTLGSRDEISKELEGLYGASFDCGVDKTGDNQVLKFYIETIDNKYLPNEEPVLEKCIKTLLEIVFDPKLENNAFLNDYIELEKHNLKAMIEGKKDSKSSYAFMRCQEEMFKGTPFGLYKYGYIEDLDRINAENLYEHYKKIISECKIDIFISGDVNEEKVKSVVFADENIQKLNEREPKYNRKNIPFEKHNGKEIVESAEVAQGNLVIGLSAGDTVTKRDKYVGGLYNSIFGGTASSKLFQIVREKYSLAYSASSNYIRHKNCFFIRCGIEIGNYEKTLNLIKEQLEDMKNGNFTEEEINAAKTVMISNANLISEEQETELIYRLGQELIEDNIVIEEYEDMIKSITKDEVINFASKVNIDLIYFLKD